MAFGMTTLIETRNYEVIKYRTGTGLVDRPTGNTVYLQPGDDEWALLGPFYVLCAWLAFKRYGRVADVGCVVLHLVWSDSACCLPMTYHRSNAADQRRHHMD